jgi:ADP-heptose:LPS heptosyltransferase
MACNVVHFFHIFAKNLKKPFVYLVRKRALGDVLWIEPVIRQLAIRNKKVIVYTKYPELFLNYPFPNVSFKARLSLLEKALWGVERALGISFFFIDLEGAYEKKPSIHFLTAYQQQAKLPVVHEYPRLYLDEQELAWHPPLKGKYVVLHLESMTDFNSRKVFGVNWELVAEDLDHRGYSIVQVGKQPVPIPGAVHIRTSVRQMMSLIRRAAFFIGIDSGPSHIAAALGVPSLIFFGSVNPAYRHFMDLFKGRILQQYCEYAGCYHDTGRPGWPACKLVGSEGLPKCAVHTTEYVLNNIDLLIKDYQIS